ncbi:MAG: hypothetical protein K8H85_14865 [Cyclobacteriaceae bacterium]|nr:hypothetical protein [Cyclobacteriaceae bacterium]
MSYQQSNESRALEYNGIELEYKIDSIKVLKDAIKIQDSITGLWDHLKAIDTYDLSKTNREKLKLGILEDGLKNAVMDSLEKSLAISSKLLDSLSPNYNLDFRARIKSSEKELYNERLTELLDQRETNNRRIKFLNTLKMFVTIAFGISALITIVIFIRVY